MGCRDRSAQSCKQASGRKQSRDRKCFQVILPDELRAGFGLSPFERPVRAIKLGERCQIFVGVSISFAE